MLLPADSTIAPEKLTKYLLVFYPKMTNHNFFKTMSAQFPLFSQVVLVQDQAKYDLQRGSVATVVEYYPMPNPEEDGYSLEGFNIPDVTLEVSASQIISFEQWQKEIELIPVDIFGQNSFG